MNIVNKINELFFDNGKKQLFLAKITSELYICNKLFLPKLSAGDKVKLNNSSLCKDLSEMGRINNNNVAIFSKDESDLIFEGYFNLVNFIKKYGKGLDISGLNFPGIDLSGANLEQSIINNANLMGANLMEANLEGARINNTILQGGNLERGNLMHSIINNSDLRRINLRNSDLREAIITKSSLRGAELWGTFLWKANFNDCFTNGLDFSRADTRGAQ